MTKEQAAEAKYPYHREDDVRDKYELRGLRDAFCRGWEAHEAQQSPTDAVAFGEFLRKNYMPVLTEHWELWNSDKNSDRITTKEVYRLFNPLEVTIQPEGWATGDKAMDNMLRDQESLKSAPQAVGPVWVKASENILPAPEIEVPIRYNEGKEMIIGSRNLVSTLIKRGYSGIEFLSESNTQQVFTREDMEKAAGAYYMCGFPHQTTPKDWVNKNYPLSI